ncbi:MAG: ABC transporter permease [Candidatus Omnitrophica bacterium]|nr:ABC transporter permease [Candidatus Omnitrophota bacterium]
MKPFGRRYINLIKELSIAWFKIKDQRSVLGFLWSFLNPLIMTTVLFFLFQSSMSAGSRSNYFLYILIGTVAWNFFVMATTAGLTSIINAPDMVRNVVFPKEILTFSAIGTFIIQHVFELAVIFLLLAVSGTGFSIHLILLPVILAIQILLIAGLSLFLACICVYALDMLHIWNVLTRMGFFMVPVFYSISNISLKFRGVVTINPMSQIIIFLRDILLYHRMPSLPNMVLVFIFSLFMSIAGYKFFRHYEHKIAEKV